jgi:integrase
MRNPNHIPRPTRRPDGRAVVRLNNRDHYLGRAGEWPKGRRSPPATIQAEYQSLIATWLANGRQLPDAETILTINQAILAYDKWAEIFYHREGTENTQIGMIRDALRVVKNLFGRESLSSFGPKKLEQVQQAMVGLGWSRNYINGQVGRVRRWIKWCVRQELATGDLFYALQSVPGVRRGTSGVRETQPVGPVPEETVALTLPFMPAVVQSMVQLQLLSVARPGEICAMRACDIDMTGAVWLYHPSRHKTQHCGRQRVIPLGPAAQSIVREHLTLDTQAYLFSPRRSEAARNAERRQNRRSLMTPSQAKRKSKENPRWPKRDYYDETSYRNAVYRACDKAFPPPAAMAQQKGETKGEWLARLPTEQRSELKQWVREHRWHPNQLRHTRATEIRRRYGLEAAQVLLGHSRADVTQIYAERDAALAARVAAQIG